jgi:hypothetical protein
MSFQVLANDRYGDLRPAAVILRQDPAHGNRRDGG